MHTFDDQVLTGQFIAEKVTTPVETAALHDEQCVEAGPNFLGVGTFTITSSVGALSGTFTTTGCGCNGPFSFFLVVTNGAGAYHGATGTIRLEGELTFGVGSTFTETATFVANITKTSPKGGEPEPLPLPTPPTSALIDRHCASSSIGQCSGTPNKPVHNRQRSNEAQASTPRSLLARTRQSGHHALVFLTHPYCGSRKLQRRA